jgi:hypothetical protein
MREAAILKISPPAIITSPEVIIAEYDAILDQWERENFYNHLSNYTNTANPALPERIRRVSVRALSSFVDTSENKAKKFVGTTGETLYAVGGTRWYTGLYTNHSKPSSIGQKHSHCLANYSNSVVIGYPGGKLPRKLLTIAKPLPESHFVCSCSG